MRPASKALEALPRTVQRRLLRAIEKLAENPYPPKARKLEGGDGELRIRIGDYRVIYEVHDDVLLVLVLKIGDRKDVYRAITLSRCNMDREADAFTLELRSGVRRLIPRIAIDELHDATTSELEHIALSSNGGTIRCEPLEVDISVPRLVRDRCRVAYFLRITLLQNRVAKH